MIKNYHKEHKVHEEKFYSLLCGNLIGGLEKEIMIFTTEITEK